MAAFIKQEPEDRIPNDIKILNDVKILKAHFSTTTTHDMINSKDIAQITVSRHIDNPAAGRMLKRHGCTDEAFCDVVSSKSAFLALLQSPLLIPASAVYEKHHAVQASSLVKLGGGGDVYEQLTNCLINDQTARLNLCLSARSAMNVGLGPWHLPHGWDVKRAEPNEERVVELLVQANRLARENGICLRVRLIQSGIDMFSTNPLTWTVSLTR